MYLGAQSTLGDTGSMRSSFRFKAILSDKLPKTVLYVPQSTHLPQSKLYFAVVNERHFNNIQVNSQ